jgi:hypothetical protein
MSRDTRYAKSERLYRMYNRDKFNGHMELNTYDNGAHT